MAMHLILHDADGDALSTRYFTLDAAAERTRHVWQARQMLHDECGDDDFGIAAEVDLDAAQERGEAVFASYRFGPIEDLLD